MSVLTSHAYYRFAQILGVCLLPAGICALVFVEFEDRFAVTGIVESERQVIVRSPLKETLVKQVFVEAGEDVAAGATLLEFEDLHNYRSELARRQVQLRNLEREKAALQAVGRQEDAQGEKLLKLTAAMDSIRMEIEVYKEQVGRLNVLAPFAGRVTEVRVNEQDHVQVGTELLSLSSPEAKLIRCMVPERNSAFLREGQRVHIKSNQFNYLRYEIYAGRVKSFSPYAIHRDGRVEYETEIALETGRDKLPLGSTALCEIVVEQQPLCMLFLSKK